MKKTLTFVFVMAALLLCGCASMKITPEERARIAEQVQENMDNKSFRIEVTQMIPGRGAARHVDNYFVTIDGDNLISQLPYFGFAWTAPYGGGKGLNFESKIREYIDSFPKPDRRQVILTTDNGEDVLVYTIVVFTNGTTSITVRSRSKDSISYNGFMVME